MLIWTSGAIATQITLNRPEEFLEVEGIELPALYGEALERIHAYAWRDGEFRAIPFQIDERGPEGGYFGEDELPGQLDDNDQLVVMLEDLGDRASACCWIEAADSLRWELGLEDPLDGGAGWLYLFTGDLPRSALDYVGVSSWEPFAVETDRYSHRYEEGNADVLTELRILPPLGNGEDFVDRFKIRMKPGFLLPWITEADALHQVTKRHFLDGPVRVIHGFWVSLGQLADLTHVQYSYYRQMTVIRNDINQFWVPNLSHMAILYDLEPAAAGEFTYFDNRGDDPEADATYFDVVDGEGPYGVGELGLFVEWASPRYGSTVIVQDNRTVPGGAATYYNDWRESGEDPWPDTGDGEVFGQQGIWLTKLATQRFQLEAWSFRLAATDSSRGGEFTRRYLHRPELEMRVQGREDCACETSVGGGKPVAPRARSLNLAPIFPNPFNPQTTITLNTAEPLAWLELALFDLSGRRVRTLFTGAIGRGSFSYNWDGKDQGARSLPSALYLCRVRSVDQELTRKVMLLK